MVKKNTKDGRDELEEDKKHLLKKQSTEYKKCYPVPNAKYNMNEVSLRQS